MGVTLSTSVSFNAASELQARQDYISAKLDFERCVKNANNSTQRIGENDKSNVEEQRCIHNFALEGIIYQLRNVDNISDIRSQLRANKQ
jgi:hypothetical protein